MTVMLAGLHFETFSSQLMLMFIPSFLFIVCTEICHACIED